MLVRKRVDVNTLIRVFPKDKVGNVVNKSVNGKEQNLSPMGTEPRTICNLH